MLPMREPKPRKNRRAKEDLAFEIAFFEGIARRDPGYVEALQILGDAYTRTGQWEKGLKIDQRLAHLCPENPLVFYNLACSYALLKELDPALAALERAIRLGYHDVGWLTQDPDLENLRQDSRFARIRDAIPTGGAQPTAG